MTLVTNLCDHGQPDQVGRYTHEGDEEFLPGTQEARPLVDAGRDEALHRTKLYKRRNHVNSLKLKDFNRILKNLQNLQNLWNIIFNHH